MLLTATNLSPVKCSPALPFSEISGLMDSRNFLLGWTLSAGFIIPIMVNNAVTLAIVVFGGLIMYFFGKDLRRLTRNSRYSLHLQIV